jgi:predicted transcriptional regulator
MNNPIRRTRPHRTGIAAPLGDLETAVMKYVWQCEGPGCLGQEVQQELARERPVAITTILTTLDRLFDKGIVQREREGKAYRYRAALSEEQLQQRIVDGVLGSLIAQFPKAVAAYFANQDTGAAPGIPEGALAGLARRVEEIAAAPAAEGCGDA